MLPAISVSHLDKWFGATHALRDVSVSCYAGDVHAFVGENGAGKSTLVKIVSGVLGASDYAGEVQVEGRSCRFGNVREAETAGVFLVPQELNIVPHLSVADYLFLNREPRRWGLVDSATLWAETLRWLRIFELPISPLTEMGELSSHEQQLVSIARAMTQGVRVLILDEPTASLTGQETALLFGRIRAFRKQGVTTLYISHRLPELAQIADVVTVMRDGTVVETFKLEPGMDAPRRIVRTMIGRELDHAYPKVPAPLGRRVLELRNWTVANPVAGRPDLVRNVNLSLQAGEVLGIFGLIGSGASDLARSMFGAHPGRVSGDILVHDRPVHRSHPADLIKAGLAYMPSDRKRDGLVLDMPVAANLSLAALRRFTRFGMVDRGAELHDVEHYISALKVKCGSVEQAIGGLSGGNQQKVVAAKWLLAEPDVLVLEEPTRGVDVGARIEIYNLINDITRQGKAVVLISTDLPEVLGMSDRIVAMRDGRLVGSWQHGATTEEDVMLHAAGRQEDIQ